MSMNAAARFQMGLRNIGSNKRRSAVTVATIAIGFVALSLFEGYFTYVYRALEQEAVMGERLGHLTVVKTGFYENGSVDPETYFFTAQELEKMEREIEKIEGVALLSPRLHASGLISNGDVSHIFLSEGISPDDLSVFRQGEFADMPGKLPADNELGVSMGSELAKMLGVQLADGSGTELVMMSSTVDGMVNASDVEVTEVGNTGSVGTNDKFILTSLQLARSLYQFEGADRLVILLDSTALTDSVSVQIVDRLKAVGLDVELGDWKTLSVYYTQVKGLFDMMYLFISLVVVIVVIASVVNTMGMAVAERTREIGTLRAIGMRARSLTGLFVIEGVLLVVVGCCIGIVLTLLAGAAINVADLRYTPPDASEEANLFVDILGMNLVGSLVVFSVLAAAASFFPARRASAKPIPEALGHV